MPFRDSSLRSRMTPKGHNQAKDLRGRALIKKGQRIFCVFSLTENTQRYKSLAGFAIFPSGAIFAFGKRDALRGARDLYHIVPSIARYIATCRAGACSNAIKLRKCQPQDPSLRQFPFVIFERSEESKGNCLRSRMTGGWLNLMILGLAPAVRLYRIRIANISPNRKRGNISIMKPICFLYLSL